MGEFSVRAAAGSLRGAVRADASFSHRWTDAGVAVEAQFTGAHLLHLSAGGCVLNDVYREAEASGVAVDGVLVSVDGDFDRETWVSTGITYSVELDSPSPDEDVQQLLRAVEDVADLRVPRQMRMLRSSHRARSGAPTGWVTPSARTGMPPVARSTAMCSGSAAPGGGGRSGPVTGGGAGQEIPRPPR